MITTLMIALTVGSTLVLTIAAIVIWLLPAASAASRFSILQIAMTSLLLLPVGVVCLPEVPLGFGIERLDLTTSVSSGLPPLESTASKQHGPALHLPVEPVGIDSSSSNSQRAVTANQPVNAGYLSQSFILKTLLMIWLVVACALFLRTLLAHFRVAFQTHFSDNELDLPIVENSISLPGTVDLICTSWQKVPVTVGIRRRRILLPDSAGDWSADQIRMVVKHELAHVLRRDVLWQFVTSIVTSLFWFQPLVWWGDRRLKLERERACDDQVIVGGELAVEYATVLVQLAATFSGRNQIPTGALSMAQKPIERRLTTILSPATTRTSTSRWLSICATVVALLVVAGVCSIRPLMPLAIAAPAAPAAPIQDDFEVEDEPAKKDNNRKLADLQTPDAAETALVTKTYSVAEFVAPSPFTPVVATKHGKGKSNIDPLPLIELIANTIRTDSWIERGAGGRGTMAFLESNFSLIISQEIDVHDEIADLLNKLRELDDVMIDMRGFLTFISDENLSKSLQRDVPKTPTKIYENEARLLYGLAFVNDSVSSFELKQVSIFNGQEAALTFPDLDIALAQKLTVQSVVSRDVKSVQSVVHLKAVNFDKSESKRSEDKQDGQWMAHRAGETAGTVIPNTENGQCMTVDVSDALPADKTGLRAILVLRPYVLDFRNE